MHSENWDDLRFVLAVAEEGSVSAAARLLGVNHATVLRRVSAFEERHGSNLFEKGPHGYTIPPDRIRVVEAAREAEAAMGAVRRLMQGRAAPTGGRVRVTSTDTFSLTVLPDILARISSSAPELHFELLTSNGHLDFARLHADITVRPAERLPQDLAGDVAARLGFAAYGMPDADGWLELRGALVGSVAGKWMAEHVPSDRISAGADSFPILARMAAAGAGRALLPCILGDAMPGLVRLPDSPVDMSVPVWVASHVDLIDAPRLRSIRAAIAAGLAEEAPRLEGRS